MLKVLFVDDEMSILQGLSQIIDWNSEGFEIVGMESNGFDALKAIERYDPDVVFTDIKMPQMTGLELLAKVKTEKLSDAYFIMLTGYSEFSYAKTALKYSCLDYILKPVDKQVLLSLLNRIRELHSAETKKKLETALIQKEALSRNIIPVLYGKYDSDDLSYVKEYIGECSGCRYISIELDSMNKKFDSRTDEEKRALQRVLYQKCLEAFPGEEDRCIFDVSIKSGSYDIGIIFSDELIEKYNISSEQDYFEELKEKLTQRMDFPIRMIVGQKQEKLENISYSFKEVMMVKSVQDFDTMINEQDSVRSWNDSEEKVEKKKIDDILHAVELNDKRAIEELASQLPLLLGQSDARVINMVINYIIFELIHLAEELDGNINQQEIFKYISDNAFEHIYSQQNSANIVKMLTDYSDYLCQLRGTQTRGTLVQVEADLRTKYSENLTLKSLGKKYFINAAYLGQLFKKQYGESFKDYLNGIRIEKAAELLLHSDKKIYEIGYEVGYHDIDYFINKFIAAKGCTPAKFRKQYNSTQN